MAGTKGHSGGPRTPSGGRPRKKKTQSEKVKNSYIKAAKELAKEFGEPIEKAMLRMVYSDKVQDSVKASIMKAYNEALLVKESESNVNVNKYQGPVIGLPETRPDPAKEIQPEEDNSVGKPLH